MMLRTLRGAQMLSRASRPQNALSRMALRAMSTAKDEQSPLATAFKLADDDEPEVRYRTQKNPVIPNIQNLEKNWENLDAGKQDDIIAYLEDRMRGDWHDMSDAEKRAVWYIYYGPWGPRSAAASDNGAIYSYLGWTLTVLLASVVGYKIVVASDKPKSRVD